MTPRFRFKGPYLRLSLAAMLCVVLFLGHESSSSCSGESNKGTLVVVNATGYECLVKIQGGTGASGPWEYTAPNEDSRSFSAEPSTYTCVYRENTYRSQSQSRSATVKKGKTQTITMTLD